MKTNRRTFFQWLTSASAGVMASRSAAEPAPALQAPDARPDTGLLLALGGAVLPSELGAAGIARVVAEFAAWVSEYRPGAELDHTYGTPEIEYTPEHPGPRWAEQLKSLDVESRRRAGKPFVDLSAERQRELIRAQIADAPAADFPDPARAQHVAVGLLAYFTASPEATDLCYQAEIGKDTCRDLAASSARPALLRRA